MFAHNPRPPREEIEKLAQSISLTVKETLRWFRDERFRSSKRQQVRPRPRLICRAAECAPYNLLGTLVWAYFHHQQPPRVLAVADFSSMSQTKRVRREPAARRPSGSAPAAAPIGMAADRRDLPTRTPSDMGASALAAMAAAARAPAASAMTVGRMEPPFVLKPEPISRAPSDGPPAKVDRNQRAQMAQTCVDCFATLPPGTDKGRYERGVQGAVLNLLQGPLGVLCRAGVQVAPRERKHCMASSSLCDFTRWPVVLLRGLS